MFNTLETILLFYNVNKLIIKILIDMYFVSREYILNGKLIYCKKKQKKNMHSPIPDQSE